MREQGSGAGVELAALVPSFARHLRAENRSPRTIESYTEGIGLFIAFLAAHGRPGGVGAVGRDDCQEWIAELLSRTNPRTGRAFSPATVANRFKSLQAFFRWAELESEIPASPMARMKPPKVPKVLKPIVGDDELKALLKACAGPGFMERRDMALIVVLLDTGARRHELVGMELEHIDWKRETIRVTGKGGKERGISMGKQAVRALDRYLRVRHAHALAASPRLWLGRLKPLTDSGIYQVLRSRAEQAGVEHLYTHRFRHTATHLMLDAGMQEADVQEQMGWESRQMIGIYGAQLQAERAQKAHKKFSPGDRAL